jgi:hypothetical protein
VRDLRITQNRYRLLADIAAERIVTDTGGMHLDRSTGWPYRKVTARVDELISAGLVSPAPQSTFALPVTLTDAGRDVLEGGEPS